MQFPSTFNYPHYLLCWELRGAYHLAKNPVYKLWTTSRGSSLFPFGMEHLKNRYHFKNHPFPDPLVGSEENGMPEIK